MTTTPHRFRTLSSALFIGLGLLGCSSPTDKSADHLDTTGNPPGMTQVGGMGGIIEMTGSAQNSKPGANDTNDEPATDDVDDVKNPHSPGLGGAGMGGASSIFDTFPKPIASFFPQRARFGAYEFELQSASEVAGSHAGQQRIEVEVVMHQRTSQVRWSPAPHTYALATADGELHPAEGYPPSFFSFPWDDERKFSLFFNVDDLEQLDGASIVVDTKYSAYAPLSIPWDSPLSSSYPMEIEALKEQHIQSAPGAKLQTWDLTITAAQVTQDSDLALLGRAPRDQVFLEIDISGSCQSKGPIACSLRQLETQLLAEGKQADRARTLQLLGQDTSEGHLIYIVPAEAQHLELQLVTPELIPSSFSFEL